jgi:hypothetical protein
MKMEEQRAPRVLRQQVLGLLTHDDDDDDDDDNYDYHYYHYDI